MLDPLNQSHVEIFRDEPVHLLPVTPAEEPKEQPLIQQTISLDGSAIKKKRQRFEKSKDKNYWKISQPFKNYAECASYLKGERCWVFNTKHTINSGTKYNFKCALAGKNQVCPKAAYIFVSIPNPKGEREFGVFILVNQHVTHS